MSFLEGPIRVFSRWCDWIAQAAVAVMMVLVGGNILLRALGKPILGVYDWTGLVGTILIAFALAYCGVERRHVRVEFVLARFPQRIQAIGDSMTGILSLGFFAVAVWQSVAMGNEMRQGGDVSMTVQTPFYPFVYAIAFGCALLWLVILIDTIKSLEKVVGE